MKNHGVWWRSLASACAWLALAGCDQWGNLRGKEKDDTPPIAAENDEEDAEAKKPAGPKGFFRNTRLPGGLSDEATDIERSLGVF